MEAKASSRQQGRPPPSRRRRRPNRCRGRRQRRYSGTAGTIHPGRTRGGSRNGTYQRTVRTSLGPIVIDVPRDRNGEYKPMAIPRYQRRTDPITSTVLKLYSSGTADEEMRLAIASIYEAHCSKSTISSIADAGGYSITPQESAEAYGELLAGFRKRGLEDIEVAVTDGLQGIDEAISSSYPKAKRQRRFAHLLRNACSKARTPDRREAADAFMGIARQEDAESGKKALGAFVERWKEKYPKLGIWSEKAEHMLTFYEFPRELRGLVYANSRVESFNKQIKRALKKQIQFVTEEALEKRLVSMFLHYNEGVGKRKARCWRSIVEYYESK